MLDRPDARNERNRVWELFIYKNGRRLIAISFRSTIFWTEKKKLLTSTPFHRHNRIWMCCVYSRTNVQTVVRAESAIRFSFIFSFRFRWHCQHIAHTSNVFLMDCDIIYFHPQCALWLACVCQRLHVQCAYIRSHAHYTHEQTSKTLLFDSTSFSTRNTMFCVHTRHMNEDAELIAYAMRTS